MASRRRPAQFHMFSGHPCYITQVKLSFVFTSDEHGYLAGAPAIKRVADEARAENPGRTLLVSSGDVFQGAPESDMAHGEPGLQLLKAAEYDVVEVGNHDFDHGPEFFRKWVGSAPYPVLAGNLKDAKTGEHVPGTRPWVIKELDGVKVGLLGVVTPDTPKLGYASQTEGFLFEDPIAAGKKAVEELKAQGCDVIGALTHLGSSGDREFAKQVPVDFILGGHTHEMREEPEMVNGVPICQPGSFRKAVGRLDLELDPQTKRPVKIEHRLVKAGAETPADDEVGHIVRDALQKLEAAEGQEVVHNAERMDWHASVPDRLDFALSQGMKRLAGTRVAIHNGKLPRMSLGVGMLTGKDLRAVLPFPNEVVKIKVPREELRQVIEAALNRKDETTLFYSGISTDAESHGPDGQVKVLELRNEDGTTITDDEIEVATTDYLAQGALGYFAPRETEKGFGFAREALRVELGARQLWNVAQEAGQTLASLADKLTFQQAMKIE